MINNTLHERTQVKVCGFEISIPSFDRCIALSSLVGTVALRIAQTVTSSSKESDCSAQQFHNEKYQYAVRSKGNCSNTASRQTVEGALIHFLELELPDSVCGLQCVRLTHGGGGWEGYVVFGAGNYDWEKWLDQCFAVTKFGECQSGGKKYVPSN